jgi:Tol biopolymer transport system component
MHRPAISADGRYVAYDSYATNLVPGDTNGWPDVFVHDTVSGTTTRVSVSSAGEQGNRDSYLGAISADGRYVAFESWSSNLVPGDTNGVEDRFVRDTVTNTTTRVVVGGGSVALSADGRYVAFDSEEHDLVPGDTNGVRDVFVLDTVAKTTARASVSSTGVQGIWESYDPAISADGRYVAFTSGAYNLVADDTNTRGDVFVRDTVAKTTTRVSLGAAGQQGNGNSSQPSISADGRYVAFTADASNLVPGDTNGVEDVFVRDRGADTSLTAPLLSKPTAPTRATTAKVFTVKGYLKPHHAAGSYPVRVYRYRRLASGVWKSYGYVKAKASDFSTYTKYAATLHLTSKGAWRLRAYAAADALHTAAWSTGYAYVTVR